jgi:hypothetical protein
MRGRTLWWLLALAGPGVLAAGAVVLWPRPPRITEANFARLHERMTHADVEAILGPPGTNSALIHSLNQEDFDDDEALFWSWAGYPDLWNDSGFGLWAGNEGFIAVRFRDGRAVGLKWLRRSRLLRQLDNWW